MTYGKRGTIDRPDAAHHSIAYMEGTYATPFKGEQLVRHPMRIKPASQQEILHQASRVNFSKTYTIEHNVKVKMVGKVTEDCLAWLSLYAKESSHT